MGMQNPFSATHSLKNVQKISFLEMGATFLTTYYPLLLESIYTHNLIAFQCDKISNFQGKIHKTFTILDLKIPYFSFVKDNSLQKNVNLKMSLHFQEINEL